MAYPGPAVVARPPGRTETQWFLDVNRFARHTGWLHGIGAAWALYLGLSSSPCSPSAAVSPHAPGRMRKARSRRPHGRASPPSRPWPPTSSSPPAVRRPRPYTVLPHAEVLVARAADWSLPSDHAVIAGALATGLL